MGKVEIRTLNNLNDELIDLKKCQIDMLKISISIFTFVSIFLGGLAGVLIVKNLENLPEIPPKIPFFFT